MTAKFDKFKEALIALCDHHQITLSPSMYDQIQVLDRDPRDGALSGGNDLLVDRTKEQPTQPALKFAGGINANNYFIKEPICGQCCIPMT